jgi:hypothetical protein
VAAACQVGAAGHQGRQGGGQGVAGAGKHGLEALELLAGQHRLRRGQHVVDELVGQRHAGDQRVGTPISAAALAMSRAVGLRSLFQSGSSQRHSVLWLPTNTVVCGSISSRKASR